VNLFLDCEWNSYGGELISMALVPPDRPPFYCVLPLPKTIDPWVAENVIPVLNAKPCESWDYFQKSLEDFLAQFGEIHVIADWPEDIANFMCSLITGPGTRINTPPLTCEVRRDLDGGGLIQHNALSDAIALCRHWQKVEEGLMRLASTPPLTWGSWVSN
jgi:hypothetical protein